MLNETKYYHLPVTVLNSTPTSDDLESPFFLIHGRDPLEGHTRLLGPGNIRYIGNDKGLILFTKLCKLWSNPAKNCKKTDY